LGRFLVERLRGEQLDASQHAEQRKADFRCLNGLLAIELKSLETAPSDRMNNLMDVLQQRADWPVFMGSAPIQAFLPHLDDRDQVERQLLERIGRPIEKQLSKADKQLAAHQIAFPRTNVVRIVILINEDHEIYDPKVVAHLVQRLLLQEKTDGRRFNNIDGVIFFSERHATAIGQQIAFPITWIEGPTIEIQPWKRDIVDLLFQKWAEWNAIALHHAAGFDTKFESIDHIPDQMKRHEAWELAYKRDRYMSDFTNDEVRNRFDEAMCISCLKFFRGSPLKPADETVMWSMSTISHLMLEMGWRGIPVTQFQYTPERLAEAARRLRLPQIAVDWFIQDWEAPAAK